MTNVLASGFLVVVEGRDVARDVETRNQRLPTKTLVSNMSKRHRGR